MKNLHNWSLVSEDARLLAEAQQDKISDLLPRLKKYVDTGQSISAVFPVFAAMLGIAIKFPEILKVTFKSQETKAAWAMYCKEQGFCDLSGRVSKPLTVIDLSTGDTKLISEGRRIDPPARQTWLPWVPTAQFGMNGLKQALDERKVNVEKRWKAQSEQDILQTNRMEQEFPFGGAFYIAGGRLYLRPSTETDEWTGTITHEGKKYSLRQTEIQLSHFLKVSKHDDRLDTAALFAGIKPVPRKVTCVEELAMGYGASEKTAKELGEAMHKNADTLYEDWEAAQKTADNLELKNREVVAKLINEDKEQTMNLTQKATAFLGNLKSVGLDLLRVQRGRATLHSAKRIIFAALPFKWGFLARLTGKAKKVENHPLTDLGLALALHGATNFAISDPTKRAKYLKYTEEMLVAAGYSVSMKMLPIEEMLDKVFAGVNESEAMTKLKELVKDTGEQVSDNIQQ